MTRVAALFATMTLAACASQSPDAPSAPPAGASTGSLGAADAQTPALDVLRRGGSFAFSLDESDPAKYFRDQCAKESGGDAAKADACYAHVREVGSHEGIRFSLDERKQLVWTSYGTENGTEAIYIEAPLAITTEGDRAVWGTPAGEVRGAQLAREPHPARLRVRFEVVDASTVTMVDPEKGRLV